MSVNNLHILVLLREVSDPRPPAGVITRGAGISERGLRRVPNPADLTALEEAVAIKEKVGGRVVALAVGPDRLDDTLRLAFSMGADRGIRFWDHGLDGSDAVADARILARFIAILKPDLVITGNRLLDRGGDPAPAIAAAVTDLPCIDAAVSLTLAQEGVEVLRKGDRGGRQVVAAPLPCAVLFEEEALSGYPSVEAVTGSLAATIEEWEAADLGLPFWELGATGAYLPVAEYGHPRPDPLRVTTPDARLPAFERILSLLSGGIKAREGRTHFLPAKETAEGLWQIFSEEGLIS